MRVLAPALLAAALAFPPQPTPQPVFRSGVDLVRFDVRVTDRTGKPIADLRPEELEIVENGQTLPLLLFQHVAEPSATYAQAALRSVSAEVSSNQGSPRGHLYLLVFDQAHIAPGNEHIAQRAADTFIRTRVRPSDRIAVVGIPGPGPELTFTADRTRAVAELAKVRGELQRHVKSANGDVSIHEAYEIAAGSDKALSAVLVRQSADLTADVGSGATSAMAGSVDRGAQRSQSDPAIARKLILENARTVVAQADASARDTLQRLADLVAQYRTVEGRKTVVFFSEGFHTGNVTRELEHVAAAAAQSYAVFYAFDLNRRGASDLSQPQLPTGDNGAEALARSEPLGSLAAETDGALIVDAATHLDASLARIADQAQDYYVVGFTPSAAALAARGQYRRVSVRVKRPGASVSARTGYATMKGAMPDRRRAIDTALAAPFAQQALRVEYTTYTMRAENAGRSRVILSLEAELPVAVAGEQKADVVFVVRAMRDGRVVASGTDQMALPDAPVEGATTGRGTYRVHFDVPPGAYLMRAVVREPGGLIGSADRKLDIRGVSGPDVTASDVILSSPSGSLPVRARVYADDGLSGMLETYGRAAEQLSSLAVTVSLINAESGEAVATLKGDADAALSNGSGFVRRVKFATPLAAVRPGPYVTRVKVNAGSETIAELTRELDIVPGRAPAPPGPPVAPRPSVPAIKPAEILAGDFVRRPRQALRESMAPPAAQASRGFDAFAESDYAAAVADLSAALKAEQSNAAVAFVLGWAHEAMGSHREAIGAWRAAATIDPKMVPAHLALADAYLRMSEPELAAQAVRAGLGALPESPELLAKLAEIDRRR